nr:glycosyltransferase [uncultured Sphaerochaeta sp.]
MKKICVVGHFGKGKIMLNGQTIKTKQITEELEKQFGKGQVKIIDTHGGLKKIVKIITQLIWAFMGCSNIILLPAHNGMRILIPLCACINICFHRQLHYIVIGGWLPSIISNKNVLKKKLSEFSGIYVETETMKKAMEKMSFRNIVVMPNFKNIRILKKSELFTMTTGPFKLCTFSRVMKEKGIESALEAVRNFNDNAGKIVFTLDIYGQIDGEQMEWFSKLVKTFPDYVKYCGSVSSEKSVDVLKDYFMLLFPTNFYTEGIPGTIIDAYAAGVPVIASRWESFCDVIEEGITGFGYDFGNDCGLYNILQYVNSDSKKVTEMKLNCIKKAEEFQPKVVIAKLGLV